MRTLSEIFNTIFGKKIIYARKKILDTQEKFLYSYLDIYWRYT